MREFSFFCAAENNTRSQHKKESKYNSHTMDIKVEWEFSLIPTKRIRRENPRVKFMTRRWLLRVVEKHFLAIFCIHIGRLTDLPRNSSTLFLMLLLSNKK